MKSRRSASSSGKPASPSRRSTRQSGGFEDYLTQVEKIVTELEEGNLSLEESLVKYQTGISALQKCYSILNEMEAKINLLVRDDKGNLITKPFPKRAKEGND